MNTTTPDSFIGTPPADLFAQLRQALIGLDASAVLKAEGACPADDPDPRLALVRAWAAVLRCRSRPENLDPLVARLRKGGWPRETVEAEALRALTALERGDVVRGVDLARRASRMARTEAILEAECVANLVLARARRAEGRSYLAMRIAIAVAAYAPPEFATWVAWEMLMSGAADMARAAETSPPNPSFDAAPGVAHALFELLDAVRNGVWDAFEAAARRGAARLEGLPVFAADLECARMVCDPWSAGNDRVNAWRSGASSELPRGLLALAGSDPLEAATFVVATPDQPGRRVVRLAVPLVQARVGALRLTQVRRQQGTTNIALAVLALAGPEGCAVAAFFAATYGFEFVRHLHQAVLDTLTHRLRNYVTEFGRIERTEQCIAMHLHQAVVLPDPRGRRPVDDRVLQVAAVHGSVTAKLAADQLNVSVRRARTVLDELADEGIFSRAREGRALFYRLDDTTFREPTGLRRGPEAKK